MPHPLHYAPPFPLPARNPCNLAPLLLLPLVASTIALIGLPFTGRSVCTLHDAAKCQLAEIAGALDQYASDTGRYPTTSEGLHVLMTRPANSATWNGPYLSHPPVDPWNRPYVYRFPSSTNPRNFDLLSRGRDGLLALLTTFSLPAKPGTSSHTRGTNLPMHGNADRNRAMFLRKRSTRYAVIGIAATAVCVISILLYRHFFTHHRTLDWAEAQSINVMEGAISQFKVDTGRFPTTAEGLQVLITAPADTPNWHGPYLLHFPHDHWGRPYIYRCPSRKWPQGFLLLSAGPDGIEGTDDDVSNESIQEIMEEEGSKFAVARSSPP
jgi:general secretion pathway protein G